jgi:polar amino acid transport system permease protein
MNALHRLFFAQKRDGREEVSNAAKVMGIGLILALLALGFWFVFSQISYTWDWSVPVRFSSKLSGGWLLTVQLSLSALILSCVLGLAIALGQRSSFLPLRYGCKIYVELVRGTPLLVQIFVLWFGLFAALRFDQRFVGGVIILSIFSAAYIAEIMRSGIESIGQSQIESAKAIGLTRLQTYRYVIAPQAFRQILPPLTGQFVNLIKDSSLLSVIALGEFTKTAQEVNSITYSAFESYLPLAIGYLLLTLPLSLGTRALEKRFKYET